MGLQQATARTAARQQRLQATIADRDRHADVFGRRTRKERREDQAAVEAAGCLPKTAPVRPCACVCVCLGSRSTHRLGHPDTVAT
jgi:hypothetical protein